MGRRSRAILNRDTQIGLKGVGAIPCLRRRFDGFKAHSKDVYHSKERKQIPTEIPEGQMRSHFVKSRIPISRVRRIGEEFQIQVQRFTKENDSILQGLQKSS